VRPMSSKELSSTWLRMLRLTLLAVISSSTEVTACLDFVRS